jgi:hypothetical protein
MTLLSYKQTRAAMGNDGTSGAAASGPRAQQVVESVVRSQLTHTISSTAIVGGPCDCIYFDADVTATVILSEDTVGVSKAYLGKQWYPEAAIKVTVISSGTTCTVGWFQKP